MGNIAVNAVTGALFPRVALVLFGDALPGIIASLPCVAALQLMPAWDTSYTIAGLMLFFLFAASTIGAESNAVRSGAMAGLAAGLLALLNPSLIVALFAVVWLVSSR